MFGDAAFGESKDHQEMDISSLNSAAHFIKDTPSVAQVTNTEAEEEQYFKILDKAEAKMRQ
jgi:hypothetical protein